MVASFTVQVPATSANLGPGFDLLGLALPLFNELTLSDSSDLSIAHGGPEAAGLPTDENHLSLRAATLVCERLGRPRPAWRLELTVRIPQARGLGSSSAAIVAGLVAANAYFGHPLSREDLLQLATRMEGHPDNVAPALYGGVTAAFTHEGVTRCLPLTTRAPGALVLAVPEFELSTNEARRALPEAYSRQDVIFNMAAVTILTTILLTGKVEWTPYGLADRVHQPFRLPLIPGAAAVLDAAKASGAWGGVISGAGPTLLALVPVERSTEVARAMEASWRASGVASRTLIFTNLAPGAELIGSSTTPQSRL